MIKRRFYKLEHSNRDAPSQSSSSSSDFELDAAEDTDESEEEQEVVAEVRGNEADCPPSSSSGYNSEDSSAHELNLDSSGVPTSDDDGRSKQDTDTAVGSCPFGIENDESVSVQQIVVTEDDGIPSDIAEYAVKRKSVFKCRLCPRIVCLTMETIRAHLKSKRHARSEKLLKEGRLKVILDDNGKLDDTDTESAAKILYKPPKKPKRPRSEMNTKKFDKKRGKSRRPGKNGGNKRRRSDS